MWRNSVTMSDDRCYYCKREIESKMKVLGKKFFEVIGNKMCKTCFYFFSYIFKSDNNGWVSINIVWDGWINSKTKVFVPSLSKNAINFLENKLGFKVHRGHKSGEYYKNCIVILTKNE